MCPWWLTAGGDSKFYTLAVQYFGQNLHSSYVIFYVRIVISKSAFDFSAKQKVQIIWPITYDAVTTTPPGACGGATAKKYSQSNFYAISLQNCFRCLVVLYYVPYYRSHKECYEAIIKTNLAQNHDLSFVVFYLGFLYMISRASHFWSRKISCDTELKRLRTINTRQKLHGI